jgi:sugar phosphate permease
MHILMGRSLRRGDRLAVVSTRLSTGRLHYAWIVAAVAFLTVVVSAGVRATPGVLMVPLEEEFHWSRATISFAVGVNLFLYGLIGPFAAALMERFSLRRVMLASALLVASGVALTTLMREPWQLTLLWGVLLGAGTGVTGTFLGAVVAARWFALRRGLVLGLLSAANAAGQLIFLPPLASIATHLGWRVMSLSLAGVTLMLVPVLFLWMRDRPEDVGLGRFGETPTPSPAAPATGNPVALALRLLGEGVHSRDFWLLSGSFFVCGASTNGLIGTHLIPACIDHGITEVTGATLLAGMGLLNFIGATASGWFSDRWDCRFLLFWYYGLRGLSLMYLPFAFDMTFYGLSIFAVFYGLDWIASVPPTVKLTTHVFGNEKAAIMFGWITAVHMIGGAMAAFGGGLLRVTFGTYLEAFMLSGLLCIAAALMVLFIGVGRRDPAPRGATASAA